MPQSKVSSTGAGTGGGWWSEVLVELLRSFHKLGTVGDPSCVNLGNWVNTLPVARHGTFCVGLEMESFANKSDVIMSGISSLGQNIFFEANYTAPTSATLIPAMLVDGFASYDVLYTLQDGVLTAQF
jgi:hypothetical protein